MKTRILTLILVFGVFLFTNCKSDDDIKVSDPLNGAWNLKNVSGGIMGLNIDYEKGEVIWNFDLQQNLLSVENNVTSPELKASYAGPATGTYNIEIIQNGELQTLFINDRERGVIILNNTILKIDDGIAADGFVTKFER